MQLEKSELVYNLILDQSICFFLKEYTSEKMSVMFYFKEMIHSHEDTFTKSNELQNCFCMAPCDYAESNLNLLFYSKY